MRTFYVKYRDGYVQDCLIEATGFEDVSDRFYAAGYKGRILSIRLAD
jgi:hypothetical protein